MRNPLQTLSLVVAFALTATAASAQLQMQEQSVGAPMRSAPAMPKAAGGSIYKPQSVDEPARPAPPPTTRRRPPAPKAGSKAESKTPH